MTAANIQSSSTWPFPASTQHRRDGNATATPLNPSAVRPDPVEEELVAEQLERDRNASDAVDPNRGTSDLDAST